VPDAILVQVAGAVLDAINAGSFSQQFVAERSYADWDLALEDDEEGNKLRVDVVPVGPLRTSLETRGSIGYQPSVDIVTRLKLGPERREADGKFTLAEIDALMYFVEELSEFFTAVSLPTFDDATWLSTEIVAAYKPSHLREFHQFTGIVRVTFSTNKTL
jgi:hypothetical protein